MRALVVACGMLMALTRSATGQEIAAKVDLDSVGTGGSSPGTGTGYAVISSDLTSLRYHITVNNLQGNITNAHFHYGPTGGVIQQITFTGKTATGTWNFADSMLNHIVSENVYVNVHTSANAAGEIRGWVKARQVGFPILLNGAQAGTASTGIGSGYAYLDDSSGVPLIGWRLTYAGLQANRTNAHFHSLPGGGVVYGITFTDSTSYGRWVNPPDSVLVQLLRRQLYVNIHTSAVPAGEIRGNLGFVGELPFAGQMDGAQAGTAATGRGSAWAVMRPDLRVHYSVTAAGLTGSITGSHFHTQRTGGVVHGVTMTNSHATGIWSPLTDNDLVDFVRNRIYFNVHTAANSGGEIRANMPFRDGTLTGTLDGAQAGTASTGRGTTWLAFDDDSAQYAATYTGLNGTYTAAHFHLAPGGNVIHPMTFANAHSTGYWNPFQYIGPLLKGNVYVNVHSSTASGGEIRANLRLGTGIPTSVPRTETEVPESFVLSQNYPNPFNPSTRIAFSVPRDSRVTLTVSNILGQKVATLFEGRKSAGMHEVVFEASSLPTGLYFYTLSGPDMPPMTRRMLLLK